jgi:nucleotide-binding universal stress UspA family protein
VTHVDKNELWRTGKKSSGLDMSRDEGKPASLHFRNVLVATDFSPITHATITYAVDFARRFASTIYVTHTVPPDIYPMVPPSEWPAIAKEEAQSRESGRLQLEEELKGLPHEFFLETGDIWQNLDRLIRSKNIDLLIVGTHGWSGMAKVLIGSTAEKIFRQADRPVLTVGPAVNPDAPRAAGFNRILYATDFGPESLAAARYAISLAQQFGAQLTLMHAVQTDEAELGNSALYTLREVIPLGTKLIAPPRFRVETGAPTKAILDAANESGADLIVLGVRRSQTPLSATTHFRHSIIHSVLTQAKCPVLTVRGL